MASDLWTIKKNGASAVTLRTLKIEGAVLDIPMMDVGTLSFLVRVASAATTKPFAEGDELELLHDGDTKFIGRVHEPAFSASDRGSFWAVTASDSWWEMERTVYRQPIAVVKDDFSGLVGKMSSRVTLNQDAWGQEISQGQQIANAIYYAAGQNPGKMSIGGVPSISSTWGKEETREITVAEAVRRANSLAPSAYAVRTYGAGIMEMVWEVRSALTLVTLDLDDVDKVIDLSGLKRHVVAPGVVFQFFSTVLDADDNPKTKITTQVAGSPGGAGTIVASFNLGPCDTVPGGAAAAYWAAINTAQYSGSIQLMELEYTGIIGAGDRLRLDGGQTEWATMDAIVHRVTLDLDRVLYSVQLGPPPGLGADDFLEQLNRLRNRPAPTAFCNVQHNGTEGTPTGVDDNGDPTTPPTGGEGEEPGVDGGATGNAPGGGTPTPNASAGGTPASAAAAAAAGGVGGGQLSTVQLTLCNGDTKRFVVV